MGKKSRAKRTQRVGRLINKIYILCPNFCVQPMHDYIDSVFQIGLEWRSPPIATIGWHKRRWHIKDPGGKLLLVTKDNEVVYKYFKTLHLIYT